MYQNVQPRSGSIVRAGEVEFGKGLLLGGGADYFNVSLCILTDVSIDILEELDLTHLRATGLQSCEEELPEAEQAPPGIL